MGTKGIFPDSVTAGQLQIEGLIPHLLANSHTG